MKDEKRLLLHNLSFERLPFNFPFPFLLAIIFKISTIQADGVSITGHITAAIKHIKVGAALAPPNRGAASSAPTAGLLCLIAGVIIRFNKCHFAGRTRQLFGEHI